MKTENPDHPGWEDCTAVGARLATLRAASRMSFREKIEWLEEMEELGLRFAAARAKLFPEGVFVESAKR